MPLLVGWYQGLEEDRKGMHQKATTNAAFKAEKVQIWLNLLNKQSLLFTVSKVISQLKVQVQVTL